MSAAVDLLLSAPEPTPGSAAPPTAFEASPDLSFSEMLGREVAEVEDEAESRAGDSHASDLERPLETERSPDAGVVVAVPLQTALALPVIDVPLAPRPASAEAPADGAQRVPAPVEGFELGSETGAEITAAEKSLGTGEPPEPLAARATKGSSVPPASLAAPAEPSVPGSGPAVPSSAPASSEVAVTPSAPASSEVAVTPRASSDRELASAVPQIPSPILGSAAVAASSPASLPRPPANAARSPQGAGEGGPSALGEESISGSSRPVAGVRGETATATEVASDRRRGFDPRHVAAEPTAIGREAPPAPEIPHASIRSDVAHGAPSGPAHAATVSAREALPTTAPVGELPAHVEWMARRGGGVARVQLDPPHLGRVDMTVRLRGSDVQVLIAATEPAAQAAVHAQRGHLADNLAARDLRLSQFDVAHSGGGDDGGRGSLGREAGDSGGQAQQRGASTPWAPAIGRFGSDASIASGPASLARRTAGGFTNARIDLHA